MNLDLTTVIELLKKLLLMIFEKYEVLKEFEALGVDITGLLGGTPATPATPSTDGRLLH